MGNKPKRELDEGEIHGEPWNKIQISFITHLYSSASLILHTDDGFQNGSETFVVDYVLITGIVICNWKVIIYRKL